MRSLNHTLASCDSRNVSNSHRKALREDSVREKPGDERGGQPEGEVVRASYKRFSLAPRKPTNCSILPGQELPSLQLPKGERKGATLTLLSEGEQDRRVCGQTWLLPHASASSCEQTHSLSPQVPATPAPHSY